MIRKLKYYFLLTLLFTVVVPSVTIAQSSSNEKSTECSVANAINRAEDGTTYLFVLNVGNPALTNGAVCSVFLNNIAAARVPVDGTNAGELGLTALSWHDGVPSDAYEIHAQSSVQKGRYKSFDKAGDGEITYPDGSVISASFKPSGQGDGSQPDVGWTFDLESSVGLMKAQSTSLSHDPHPSTLEISNRTFDSTKNYSVNGINVAPGKSPLSVIPPTILTPATQIASALDGTCPGYPKISPNPDGSCSVCPEFPEMKPDLNGMCSILTPIPADMDGVRLEPGETMVFALAPRPNWALFTMVSGFCACDGKITGTFVQANKDIPPPPPPTENAPEAAEDF